MLRVRVNISPGGILARRGLGPDNRARRFIAGAVGRLCEAYVPLDTGKLSRSYVVSSDGATLTYPGPYARYQYVGIAASGAPLRHSDPMRGAKWEKRMLADKSRELEREIEGELHII